ncbi:phage tail terminator protein [Aquabacter cavernae]|uniref:phage tail terminator protein n=1 Tax=Aquabacter cavernae TaxID=2496029 RepID=UPI000F8F412B|nr:hypothetical protein [Aquabacter cavernae]
MSTVAVREALVALLEQIPNIGRVHGYERFGKTEKDFLALYATDGMVRGWRVSRPASGRRALLSGRTLVTDRWVVVGMLGLKDEDESEIVACDLADAVIAAERSDPTLGGVVRGVSVDGATGMQLVTIEPVMFAGVLCHRVTLTLDVQYYAAGPTGAGGLDQLAGAAGRLVGAVVQRLRDEDPAAVLKAVEGRIAWDADDAPADLPGAIVVPIRDDATPDPETNTYRQRVDRAIGVIVIAPAHATTGDGALVAGGLEVLRETVRMALIGWQPDGLDIPLLYAGGEPVPTAPGLVAWRDTYVPSVFVET